MKTTAPKKYCVKPNTGFVESGETQMVSVIMQAQREWPADINQCKDKFLVQSTASDGKKDFAELFAKGREGIKESKLRVSYVQPAPPPSPVPEGEEKDGEDRDVSGDNRALGRMFTNKPDFNTARSEATAARAMPEDVGTLQRELEKYRLKNESLTTDLNMALKNPASSAVRGFSLLHLLITGAFPDSNNKRFSYFLVFRKHRLGICFPNVSTQSEVGFLWLVKATSRFLSHVPSYARTHLSVPPPHLFWLQQSLHSLRVLLTRRSATSESERQTLRGEVHGRAP